MKSWFMSRKRKGLGVEAQLRASRPKAPEQLVRSISMRINGRPLYAGRRARLGLVAVLGAVSLAVLGATGGFSYAATSIQSAVNATTGVAHFSGVLHFSSSNTAHSAAGNQYGVAPHITKVSPTTKIIGGTTALTVSGTNIQANSVTVAGVSVSPSTNTTTKVIVTAPSHPSGTLTGPVHIVTDFGSDSSQSLTIYAVPTIGASGLSDTTLEPGLTLTITGTGFTGATAVKFGTKSVAPTSVNSDTQLTVVIPTGLPASGTVTVTGPAGTSAASAQSFTFSATAPSVKSFSPAAGVAAGQSNPATSVDIIGSGFASSDTVKFNGVTAASKTFISSTEFKATAPAGATAGPISVVDTVGGAGISKTNFTPIKNPSITSVGDPATPASGGGGAANKTITIKGSNLQGVGTTVTFTGDSTPQKTTDVKGTTDSISVKVPKDAATGTVTVSNDAGSDSASFTLIVLPTVTSFSATHAPAAIPGDTLTINGTGFNGVTSVAIGKSVVDSADFTTHTATQIKLAIPAGTTTNSLSVTNAAGTAKTKDKLTMAAAPSVKTSPAAGVALGQTNPATTLTFTGSGFNGVDSGASTVVKFPKVGGGTVSATPLSVTDTTLTVKAPSNTAAGQPIVSSDAGDGTAKTSFTPVKNPSVTSGSPTVDDGGDFGGKPGATTITLNGSFTGLSATDVKVTFPSVVAAQTAKVSKDGSSLTVKIPAGASDGSLTVSNSAGSDTITGFIVIVRAPAPTGPLTWTHGTTITVTGSDFLGITSVKVGANTIAASGISITDNTHMTITLPAGAKTGTNQKVMMKNAAGTGTLSGVTIN
jgi:hypothetical protein